MTSVKHVIGDMANKIIGFVGLAICTSDWSKSGYYSSNFSNVSSGDCGKL